jgi:glutamyl-tRNA reductase
MEDLSAFAEAGRAERRGEIAAVRAVIDDEVARFKAAVAGRQVEPLVSSFRRKVEDLRIAEVARLGADEQSQAQIDAATKSILNKLLHGPMTELREAAGTPRGERLAEAMRELFDVELDD